MLLPFASRKLARGLHGFAERFHALRFFFHGFHEDAAVELMRRLDAEKVQDGGGEIEVAARLSGGGALAKIRPGGEEDVVDVELTQSDVRPFARGTGIISDDVARYSELIRLLVP